MIGGFLGAGKSTAVVALAKHYRNQGLKVGLISNDQGAGLVDTSVFKSHGFPVEEIAGGCFCCRFDSLAAAAQSLTDQTRPDVFIAEPVGSCTDLVATVSYPLRRIYGDAVAIAPLSVLLDPTRAMRILGLADGRRFSKKVEYIYLKQIEEARFVLINKSDLLTDRQLNELRATLTDRFPDKHILAVSARSGSGLQEWMAALDSGDASMGEILSIDYDIYADGEALLGWLNATVEVVMGEESDATAFLTNWCNQIKDAASKQGIEIAHLKMTLSPQDGSGEIATVNLVQTDYIPEAAQELMDPFSKASVIINLRCEATPKWLELTFNETRLNIEKTTMTTIDVQHLEVFSPARPEPTHRVALQESPS